MPFDAIVVGSGFDGSACAARLAERGPGLFVADGSLYPRSPGIAPSRTIAALAERQASLME